MESRRKGFASFLLIECSACGARHDFATSSRKSGRSAYAVNELSTFAFRTFGAGHSALAKFALVLNMPKPVDRHCTKQHIRNALDAAEVEVDMSMKSAGMRYLFCILAFEGNSATTYNFHKIKI